MPHASKSFVIATLQYVSRVFDEHDAMGENYIL
jgi:hypothetical protein